MSRGSAGRSGDPLGPVPRRHDPGDRRNGGDRGRHRAGVGRRQHREGPGSYRRRAGTRSQKGEDSKLELGVRFLAADVRELSPAANRLDHADFVFHAAAVTSSAQMVARPDEVLTTAVEGTRNVLDLARALGARSVVYVSSMEVYGQGLIRRRYGERPGHTRPRATLAAATRRESGGPRR